MNFDSGTESTFDANGKQIILDLKDGLDFLSFKNDGIGVLRRIGTNGFTYANQKIEWDETALATRRETVTIADNTTTSIAVANSKQYQVNNLVKVESEVMRVTALADATHLTVTRGYAGTTAAAHAAKPMFSLGSADPEGSDAPTAVNNLGDRLYNYSQTLTRSVSLTADQIAALNTEGNPLTGNIKRRFIEINRELFQAVLYGVRYQDTSNEIYAMGGGTQFVTTNVSNVGGALSVSAIDAVIKSIVDAGGDPKLMVMGTKQKQKLDALDASLVRLGLREKKANAGGNPNTMTWMSGIMDHDVEVMVDPTVLDDQVWILDTDYIEIGHKSHNGVVGNFAVTDATTPGADRTDRVIRGKYSVRWRQEKSCGYLYGLS